MAQPYPSSDATTLRIDDLDPAKAHALLAAALREIQPPSGPSPAVHASPQLRQRGYGARGLHLGLVDYRLRRYGAGRCLDYETASTNEIATAIVEEMHRDVDCLPVVGDGAARAAQMIAELL